MNALRSALVLLVCAGLATGQVSGMHAHLDADGFSGQLRGAHVHLPFSPPVGAAEYVGPTDLLAAHEHAADTFERASDHAGERSGHAAESFAGHAHRGHGHSSDVAHATRGPSDGEAPADSGEQDVVVAKTTAVPLKVAFVFIVSFLCAAFALVAPRTAPLPALTFSLRPGRIRWRPPLRAPPLSLAR